MPLISDPVELQHEFNIQRLIHQFGPERRGEVRFVYERQRLQAEEYPGSPDDIPVLAYTIAHAALEANSRHETALAA